jgi:ribosomal protein S18 acetylase RimI-like enzyme
MSKLVFVLDIRVLPRDEWLTLRDIRLSALQESPEAFLSTYELEKGYDAARWQAEFSRGSWNIGYLHRNPVSLLGTTRETGQPHYECYIEYLWVAPQWRRSGLALGMIAAVLKRLQAAGVQTVFLWVLDGNDSAVRLYERAGFARTHQRQPIDTRPGRTEERMRLELG